MPTKSVVVGSAVGLHARPAAIISEAAADLDHGLRDGHGFLGKARAEAAREQDRLHGVPPGLSGIAPAGSQSVPVPYRSLISGMALGW